MEKVVDWACYAFVTPLTAIVIFAAVYPLWWVAAARPEPQPVQVPGGWWWVAGGMVVYWVLCAVRVGKEK